MSWRFRRDLRSDIFINWPIWHHRSIAALNFRIVWFGWYIRLWETMFRQHIFKHFVHSPSVVVCHKKITPCSAVMRPTLWIIFRHSLRYCWIEFELNLFHHKLITTRVWSQTNYQERKNSNKTYANKCQKKLL